MWLMSQLRNVCLPQSCEGVHGFFFPPSNSAVLTSISGPHRVLSKDLTWSDLRARGTAMRCGHWWGGVQTRGHSLGGHVVVQAGARPAGWEQETAVRCGKYSSARFPGLCSTPPWRTILKLKTCSEPEGLLCILTWLHSSKELVLSFNPHVVILWAWQSPIQQDNSSITLEGLRKGRPTHSMSRPASLLLRLINPCLCLGHTSSCVTPSLTHDLLLSVTPLARFINVTVLSLYKTYLCTRQWQHIYCLWVVTLKNYIDAKWLPLSLIANKFNFLEGVIWVIGSCIYHWSRNEEQAGSSEQQKPRRDTLVSCSACVSWSSGVCFS